MSKRYSTLLSIFLLFAVQISSENKYLNQSTFSDIAIAYNTDESKLELGAAILDLHLFSSDGNSHLRGLQINHSSLQIGQFDVPYRQEY